VSGISHRHGRSRGSRLIIVVFGMHEGAIFVYHRGAGSHYFEICEDPGQHKVAFQHTI